MGKRLTTEEFIERARATHGDRYDYSKVRYVNVRTTVIVGCEIHGYFKQLPKAHIKGHNCLKCSGNHALTTKEWVNKVKKVHKEQYNYSKVEYVASKAKVTIGCKKHGDFRQLPNSHANGNGCPKCNGRHKPTTKEWISKARDIHGDKYNYNKAIYTTSKDAVIINCGMHGDFLQEPARHNEGKGCPKCNSSRGKIR